MKELLICKSCGYIIEKARLRDKCPVCGVSSKMFEPYTERLTPRRKFLLSLDIHPVLVHFPVSFNAAIFFMAIASLIIRGEVKMELLTTVNILSYCLPVVIAAAFCGGLFDGKIRFRKVTTPILVRKIIFGIVFFLISAALVLVNIFYNLNNTGILCAVILLTFLGLVCSTILARYGTSLLNAKFPG
jgi:O-antigen/teichoic acid export membrane protein